MSKNTYIIQEQTLTDIADAIREKEESEEPIQVSDFSTRIENLPTGGINIPPFSTTEIVVGTWIDNKPLYRKTLTKDGTITSTSETVAHLYFSDYGITTSDIMFLGGESNIIVKNNNALSYPVNYIDASNGNKIIRTRPRADNNGEVFVSIMNGVMSLNTEFTVVVNLYYTKTTDSPVADVSTIPGNNFSTTERAVSTMSNGDIVYEKTVFNNIQNYPDNTVVRAHGIDNIKEVWIDNGSFTYLSTTTLSNRGWIPVNYQNHNQNVSLQNAFCNVDATNLTIRIGSWMGYSSGGWNHYTTLRYTKNAVA